MAELIVAILFLLFAYLIHKIEFYKKKQDIAIYRRVKAIEEKEREEKQRKLNEIRKKEKSEKEKRRLDELIREYALLNPHKAAEIKKRRIELFGTEGLE